MASLRVDGRWVARKRVNQARIVGYGKTSEEADENLRQNLADFLNPQLIEPRQPNTLHDCAVALWEPRIQQTSKETQRRYSACYAQHIYPHLGSKPITEIRSSDVQQWVNCLTTTRVSRSGKGAKTSQMSPKTILFTVGVFRQIINCCIDEGIISRSPARRISMPKQLPKRQRVMDVDEAKDLLESCRGFELQAVLPDAHIVFSIFGHLQQ